MVNYEVNYYEHSVNIVEGIFNQSKTNILDEEYEELGNMLSELDERSRLDLVLYVVEMIEEANKDIIWKQNLQLVANSERSCLVNYEKWEKLIKFISWFVSKNKEETTVCGDKQADLLETLG